MRLWLLDQVADVQSSLEGLVRVMVERADKERDILLPGYTHLQVRARRSVALSASCSSMRWCSAVNRSDGPTFCSRTRFRSKPTLSVSDNSFRVSLFSHSVVVPSLATPLLSTGNSSLANSGFCP